MVAVRKLTKPPIAEAAINLRVKPTREFFDAELQGMAMDVKERVLASFPGAQMQLVRKRQLEFKVEAPSPDGKSASGVAATSETIQGFRFTGDGFAGIFRPTEFIVSHLEAYDSFEALLGDAQKAWTVFKEVMKPAEVVRIGLRYINRIPLELPMVITDYFTAVPELPEELEQDIEGYMVRTTVGLPRENARVNLTQALESSVDEDVFAILDIDVFGSVEFKPGDAEIWAKLEQFRGCKNRFFFGLVTEKTLEPYL